MRLWETAFHHDWKVLHIQVASRRLIPCMLPITSIKSNTVSAKLWCWSNEHRVLTLRITNVRSRSINSSSSGVGGNGRFGGPPPLFILCPGFEKGGHKYQFFIGRLRDPTLPLPYPPLPFSVTAFAVKYGQVDGVKPNLFEKNSPSLWDEAFAFVSAAGVLLVYGENSSLKMSDRISWHDSMRQSTLTPVPRTMVSEDHSPARSHRWVASSSMDPTWLQRYHCPLLHHLPHRRRLPMSPLGRVCVEVDDGDRTASRRRSPSLPNHSIGQRSHLNPNVLKFDMKKIHIKEFYAREEKVIIRLRVEHNNITTGEYILPLVSSADPGNINWN